MHRQVLEIRKGGLTRAVIVDLQPDAAGAKFGQCCNRLLGRAEKSTLRDFQRELGRRYAGLGHQGLTLSAKPSVARSRAEMSTATRIARFKRQDHRLRLRAAPGISAEDGAGLRNDRRQDHPGDRR